MQELIDRLGTAGEPSREIDAEIARAVGWTTRPHHDKSWYPDVWINPKTGWEEYLPKFTRSFDEAITLLPEGMVVIDLTLSWDTCKERGHPAATIRWYPPKTPDPKDWHARVVTAKTIPLTVCLAALEARAALTAA